MRGSIIDFSYQLGCQGYQGSNITPGTQTSEGGE